MIRVYDRKRGTYFMEKVAGGKMLSLLYDTAAGRPFLFFAKRKFVSGFYGKLMDTAWSKKMIPKFAESYDISLDEAEDSLSSYGSFNDFFVRRLKKDARPFSADSSVFSSPVDARLLVLENLDPDHVVQVKGLTYSLSDLLKNRHLAEKYRGGTVMVFRLNPSDYHRFHFTDHGTPGPSLDIPGLYYSVNPVALRAVPRLYVENRRTVTIFRSANFGSMLYVEVGATNVGTIINTFKENVPVQRGDEKGYFRFGGSTVILFLLPGAVKVAEDILAASASGMETKVLCGESIGVKP